MSRESVYTLPFPLVYRIRFYYNVDNDGTSTPGVIIVSAVVVKGVKVPGTYRPAYVPVIMEILEKNECTR